MTKRNTAAILLSSALVAGYVWAGHRGSEAHATAPATAVRPAKIVAPGRVESMRDPVALAFETGGRIVSIDVDEGAAVQAGQIIARLDDRLAKARVDSAAAALAQARARRNLAQRGPRREDIEAAKAQAQAASAEATHRQIERSRSNALGATGAVPTATVDADEAAARVATATAAAAEARFQSIARGTRSELIAEATAAVDAAVADLEAAKVALEQCTLRAPHGGVILRRKAEVGAIVTAQNPSTIATLADVAPLEVRAEIDEADVAALSIGKLGYAMADAFGDRQFPVRVARITRELGRKTIANDDPRAHVDTRVLEVILRFEPPPNALLPLGMRMFVHLE